MEPTELDTALEELEVRLERLRALYEQYFLGIEKLEPSIPRKDVDRRIFMLRREKIRNTGKRFKLQTLIQRYNTFQQYWQRICREIENGTYRRHVLRAERTIGPTDLKTIAARRRFGKERPAVESSEQPEAATPSTRPGPASKRRPTTVPPSSRSRTPTLVGLPTPPPPAALAPATPGRPVSPALETRVAATQRGETRQALGGPQRRSTPPLGSRPPPAQFESLELDMDFMGDWDPQTKAKGRPAIGTSPGFSARSNEGRPQPAPQPSVPRRPHTLPPDSDDHPTPPAPRPVAPAPSAPRARLAPPPKPGRQVPPKPLAPEAGSTVGQKTPEPTTANQQPAARVTAARAAGAAVPPKSVPTPAAGTPSVRPLRQEVPPAQANLTAPAFPASPRVPAEARTLADRAASNAKSQKAPLEPRPAMQTKVSPQRSPAESGVTETRLRELHTRLQEANKQAGQKPVSLDGLAKTLRAAETKLRAQHGNNRRIEFEVVLKEGKPVVKPVVR